MMEALLRQGAELATNSYERPLCHHHNHSYTEIYRLTLPMAMSTCCVRYEFLLKGRILNRVASRLSSLSGLSCLEEHARLSRLYSDILQQTV